MHKIRCPSAAILLATAIVIIAGCSTPTPPPTTGSLQITVAGPPGTPAAITVGGPSGFNQAVTATTTLSNLVPGPYTIAATNVVVSNSTYAPTPNYATVNVVASNTPAVVSVSYAIASGSVTITVTGLPSGVLGSNNISIILQGPKSVDGVTQSPQTFSNLTPGSYTLTAYFFTQGNTIYGASPPTQTFTVPASSTPVAARVMYSVVRTGTIRGTVTSSLGGGIGGVSVTVGPTYGSMLPAVQTAGDGSYIVTRVPPGPGQVFVDNVPAGVPVSCVSSATPYQGVGSSGTATVNVVVTCTPTGWVQGTVTSSLGGGIAAGVLVGVTPTGGQEAGTTQTGANGSYRLAVPVGPGTGSVAVTGVPTNCTDPSSVSYSGLSGGGTATANVVVTCTPLIDAVSGRVTWPGLSGVPCPRSCPFARATVTVTPTGGPALPSVLTNANGFYAVTGVPVGAGTGSVSAFGGFRRFHYRLACQSTSMYSGLTSSNTVTVNTKLQCHGGP